MSDDREKPGMMLMMIMIMNDDDDNEHCDDGDSLVMVRMTMIIK